FREVGVESATQTFVGSNQNEQITLVAAKIEQRMMEVFIGSLRELAEDLHHFVRKRPRRDHTILRALELRGRNHLHGFGNLLRVLYRLNSPANIQKIRHRVTSLGHRLSCCCRRWLSGRCGWSYRRKTH